MNQFTCRVIKIIDDRHIVLNCGELKGVKERDRFNIYSDQSIQMTDPFSGEPLGEFRGIKAKLEVSVVYEKMCICQNAEKIGGFAEIGLAVSQLAGKSRTLNVDIAQISGGLEPEVDEPIRVGDYAEKVD